MISLPGSVRVFLWRAPADLRKSYDSLSGMVRGQMREDPLSGHLFVFCNRRRTQVKILYWDRDGLAIWQKRLERGTFRLPLGSTEPKQLMGMRELVELLEGIIPRRHHLRWGR
jgi:transposase